MTSTKSILAATKKAANNEQQQCDLSLRQEDDDFSKKSHMLAPGQPTKKSILDKMKTLMAEKSYNPLDIPK